MRWSRCRIESESEAVAGGDGPRDEGRVGLDPCVQFTLSTDQIAALNQLAEIHDLAPRAVLSRLVDAALAGPELFDHLDRQRLRRCLELLKAIEEQVARVARSMSVRQLPQELASRRADELGELGGYLHRVGSVLLPLLRHKATEAEQRRFRRRHEAYVALLLRQER
jgi:hypothetical protein